jgi:hypothetical protein
MIKRISMFVFIFLSAGNVLAQSTLPAIPNFETQKGIMEALNQQKPYLESGMRVISVENGRHVLVGGNGRYIVKGTLWDMYDGVAESQLSDEVLKPLPEALPLSDYYVDFGNPESQKTVYLYVNYGCTSCDLALAPLKNPKILSKYRIRVMLLNNSQDSYAIARHVYCESDKKAAFTQIFLKGQLPNKLNQCDNMIAKQVITLAHSQGVYALPLTYFSHLRQSVLGDPNVAYSAAD